MSIKTTLLKDRQLTIHTAHGVLSYEVILAAIKAYNATQPTTYVLWDLREAILTQLTADRLRTIIHFSTQYDSLRPGGKTALVVSNRPGDYGMARMAEIMNNVEKSDIDLEAFHDYDEALAWLGVKCA